MKNEQLVIYRFRIKYHHLIPQVLAVLYKSFVYRMFLVNIMVFLAVEHCELAIAVASVYHRAVCAGGLAQVKHLDGLYGA